MRPTCPPARRRCSRGWPSSTSPPRRRRTPSSWRPETSEIAELARTYQRLARSLRQTLALKARLVRERAAANAGARVSPPREPEWPHGPLQRLTPPVRAHVDRVHAAVMRFVERETEPSDFEGFYETEVYDILVDLAAEEGFLEGPPDILAVRILEIMSLRTPPDAPSGPPQDVPADPDSS